MIRLVTIDRLGHRKNAFSKLPKGANKGIPLPYREPRERDTVVAKAAWAQTDGHVTPVGNTWLV